MDRGELEFILREGEGYKIEFKEGIKNIDKEMVAFANAEGGRIFVGVTDDNKIKGIEITNKLKSELQHTANNCDPSIEIRLEKFENILIIEVKEGKDKPYKCKEGFYLRQGANSQKLKRDEIINLVIDEGKIKFDEQINKNFDFKKDFDEGKLNDYLIKAGISKKISVNDILFGLSVVEKNKKLYFNNTGILFFAKEPQKFVKESYITCVRYKGGFRSNIIDRRDIFSDLVTQIEEAMKFVEKNIRIKYEFSGKPQREEIYEYPLGAIREAIINAVMHRDYFNVSSNVYVHIYSDRIEIINPGGLPSGMSRKDFGKKSVRRNRLIADLFQRIGFIEKIGSGIIRMNDLMKEHGLKEPKYEFDDFFTITFYGPGEIDLGEKIDSFKYKLNDRQFSIIEYLKMRGRITNKECQELCKTNRMTAFRDLNDLVKKFIIEKVGKTGRWAYYTLKR